jgi:5-methylcytosine-specific restriction endonuclease McrA
MPGPVRCRCGAVLVEELTDDEVTPIGGEAMTFRRTTDFIACSECHSVYNVAELRVGHTAQESLVGTQESGESLVDALERLLDGEMNGDEPR